MKPEKSFDLVRYGSQDHIHESQDKSTIHLFIWPHEFFAIEVDEMVRNLGQPDFRFPCNLGDVPFEFLKVWKGQINSLDTSGLLVS
jgi:hypothetical protein